MTKEATVTIEMACDEHRVRTTQMCVLHKTKDSVDQDILHDVPTPVNCITVVTVLSSLWIRPV